MIKELLEKRVNDYLQTTQEMMGIYEEKLIRAMRFFTQSERDVQITAVRFFPNNSNFVINVCKVLLEVGDVIKLTNNELLTVTESNINQVPTNEMNIILPIKVLEESTAVEIYQQIKIIDEFVGKHGMDMFYKVLSSGITHLDDILNEENQSLLEEITNPIDNILKSLDELQRVQYHIFLEDKERRIH